VIQKDYEQQRDKRTLFYFSTFISVIQILASKTCMHVQKVIFRMLSTHFTSTQSTHGVR